MILLSLSKLIILDVSIIIVVIIVYPSKSAQELLYTLERRFYPQMFGDANWNCIRAV